MGFFCKFCGSNDLLKRGFASLCDERLCQYVCRGVSRDNAGLLPLLRYFAFVFAAAFAINLVWEIAQLPFYEGHLLDSRRGWYILLRACVGDGVITLEILLVGRLLFGTWLWPRRLTPARGLVMLAAGATIAVIVEIRGRWSYSELMPVIPVVEAGLVPILQMMILPWAAFKLAFRMGADRDILEDPSPPSGVAPR